MRGIEEHDHYELLEVGRAASAADIDHAYQAAQHTYGEGSLALYSVFDGNAAAEIRARLDQAYAVLSDVELREAYDRTLPNEMAAATSPSIDFTEENGVAPGEVSNGGLAGFDPAEQASSLDEAAEEFDAFEDDESGEFDGVRLRRNRLFRGYEIADIADVTKVGATHLRNIEEENFGDLPADVYVRGFLAAYAKTIGLDPKIVVPSYMARVKESRSGSQRGRFLARR